MKKVLIVGMLDSVHLSRWLAQFKEENVAFTIFPSKKFRRIHSELLQLIEQKNNAKYVLVKPYQIPKIAGYIDFFLFKSFKLFRKDFRLSALSNLLNANKFDFVHAIEIQGAGYLYSNLPSKITAKNRLILTNWGSDIYFFAQDAIHSKKINKVLRIANFYSAECERDYKLVQNFEFKGKFLPCIPNSGGFSKHELHQDLRSTKDRHLIICKGYGGLFGQVEQALPAIENALHLHKNLSVFFYSVTPDVIQKINSLKNIYGNRVAFSTVSKPLDRKSLLELFKMARIYIGCSKSDAISTSFLEALVYGAYPIQTNTSCANEWKKKGFECEIVPLDSILIKDSVIKVLSDIENLNKGVTNNIKLARIHLDEDFIKLKSKEFYGIN